LRRAIDELDASEAEGTITIRKPSLDDVFMSVTAEARELIDTKG
jgi:ABC-2 type transport system ATP-binding protein